MCCCAFIIILASLSSAWVPVGLLFCKIRHPWVREFAIGMGPKIFAHVAGGTERPILFRSFHWGYVRMAGWGERREIKTGTPVSWRWTLREQLFRVNLSGKKLSSQTALPMNVTDFDSEDKLQITGIVIEETKLILSTMMQPSFEEDGTEVRMLLWMWSIKTLVSGDMMTNCWSMNNFILSIVVYSLLAFMQGGAVDYYSSHVQVVQGVVAKAGLKTMTDCSNQWYKVSTRMSRRILSRATSNQEKNPSRYP